MSATSVGLGLAGQAGQAGQAGFAGQAGEGTLHLPNLGTNCAYPLRISGFGGGLQAGISVLAASGAVTGMKRISDVTGDYSATQGEATVLAGAATTQMKNNV